MAAFAVSAPACATVGGVVSARRAGASSLTSPPVRARLPPVAVPRPVLRLRAVFRGFRMPLALGHGDEATEALFSPAP